MQRGLTGCAILQQFGCGPWAPLQRQFLVLAGLFIFSSFFFKFSWPVVGQRGFPPRCRPLWARWGLSVVSDMQQRHCMRWCCVRCSLQHMEINHREPWGRAIEQPPVLQLFGFGLWFLKFVTCGFVVLIDLIVGGCKILTLSRTTFEPPSHPPTRPWQSMKNNLQVRHAAVFTAWLVSWRRL